MAPKAKNPDDDVKLLFACLTYGKPEINFNEVSRVMGLKKGATAMRFARLSKKLNEEFGWGDNSSSAGATANATPQKRGKKAGVGSKKKQKLQATTGTDDEDDEALDGAEETQEEGEDI